MVLLRFWDDESGQDMAEYALAFALVALVLVATISAFRGAIASTFQSSSASLNSGAGT